MLKPALQKQLTEQKVELEKANQDWMVERAEKAIEITKEALAAL